MTESRRARILCISFSDIAADARVLRQLDVLSRYGHVTTLSYGGRPAASDDHIEIDRGLPSLPQTVPGVLKLALRRYEAVELDAPAVKSAHELLAGREFDVVVANEARALPLAYTVAGSPRVWCDLHEWAPAERSHVLSWRLLVAPFMDWICARYLPRVDVATSVGAAICSMYEEHYGVVTELVRNARPHVAGLAPSPMEADRIRLVHSGGAVPGRNIEALIDAVDDLGDGYSLDLFLIAARQGDAYWKKLLARIEASPRTTLHEPAAPSELPAALNPYDLGVYLLPPHTPNHRLALPNKLFDFIQARVGVVFGPGVETDRVIRDHGIGVVTEGYGAEDLRATISSLTREDIAAFKQAADAAAETLSSDTDIAVEERIMARLTEHRQRGAQDGSDRIGE